MQRAVCTLCTSFGSWSLFGLFPFRGTAYGAYGRIRMTMESGLSPTARRHWSLFRPRKPKVHTAVHTAFPPCNPLSSPYRKRPAESPRRPGAGAWWNLHGFHTSTHSRRHRRRPLAPGRPLYAVLWPLWRAFAPRGAGWRASPPSAPTGPPTGYGAPPAPKRGDPLRPLDFLPRLKAGDSYSVSPMGASWFGGFPLHGRSRRGRPRPASVSHRLHGRLATPRVPRRRGCSMRRSSRGRGTRHS